MSQSGIINVAGGGGGGSPVQTLTGDTGGAVPPTANNINLLGGSGIAIDGDIGTSTLTVTLTGVSPSYVNVVGPATYVATATDYFISCNSTAGVVTVQLPDAPANLYDQFVIKDRTGTASVNNVNVTTVSGIVLIDGFATQTFIDNYESLEIIWNGVGYESF